MSFRHILVPAALGLMIGVAPLAAPDAGAWTNEDRSLPFGRPSARPLSSPAAPERATLVSDRLEIVDGNRLVASGAVEVFHRGSRLKASRITYDQSSDRLLIEGPISLVEDGGQALILASQADLSADLTEGILTSARLVMNQQLQMAANRMTRIGGRYTTLDQVVASSCMVCAAHPVPLWEIRAKRVIHDQAERQIYFDHAQFRVAGVPVAWLPQLRMPDPTLDRATGFLNPSLRTTSDLGPGLRIPYFIVMGEDRDLTVTPYLTFRDSYSLDLRWRQAFRTGTITLQGALTRDKLRPGETRGYFFANGEFALPEDFRLAFAAQTTSDNAYLLDYGISDADRLDSRVELSRVRRNSLFSARVISFQSLRDSDNNNTLPTLLIDSTFHRRFSLGPFGGEGGLKLQSHSHYRTSSDPGYDINGQPLGRDMSRISGMVDWRRSFQLGHGIEATILGEAKLDSYLIRQDNIFEGRASRRHLAAGVELRWPWLKVARGGATHVIEPVIQIIRANRHGGRIPNEDSTLVEFDEGNLFSLDRFPGWDAVEQDTRANLGVTWTRHDPQGWSLGLTMGRVLRWTDLGQFGPASGLGGKRSDWLLGASIDWQGGLAAAGRAVFDDDFALSKAEMRLALLREDMTLSTTALWALKDPGENRLEDTREITFDASWKATPNLTAKFSGSYDFMSDRGTLAGMGMEFRNECVSVDLSLSRRFTSSTSVKPTTDFGISVDLIGFGGSKAAGPARRC